MRRRARCAIRSAQPDDDCRRAFARSATRSPGHRGDLLPNFRRLVCDSKRQGRNRIAPAGIIDGPFLATLRTGSLKRRRSSDGKDPRKLRASAASEPIPGRSAVRMMHRWCCSGSLPRGLAHPRKYTRECFCSCGPKGHNPDITAAAVCSVRRCRSST